MLPLPPPNQLHPRYWLARCMAWLWLDHAPGGDAPAPWAGTYEATRRHAQSWMGLIRQAHTRWEEARVAQGHCQSLAGLESTARVALAHERLAQAMATAGDRFNEQDPDAVAWNQACLALEEAHAHALSVREQGQALEAQCTNPDLAGLLASGFGTEHYSGGAMARWRDERTAQKCGLVQFLEQRQVLLEAMSKSEDLLAQAQTREQSLSKARCLAWEARGAQYVDPVLLERAHALHGLAALSTEELDRRKQHADREGMQARHDLIQCLKDFHAHGGVAVAELGRAVAVAVVEHGHGDPDWPDIDRWAFVREGVAGDSDSRRKHSIGRANQAFLGQGDGTDVTQALVPAWLVLAYGNAEGLPGTAMAQAAMGAQHLG